MATYRFDSVQSFARAAELTYTYGGGRSQGGHWDGGITHATAYERALLGDTSLVERAESLLDKIEAEIEVPRSSWTPSPFGAYAIVPEAIAGMPDPMRARCPVYSDVSPVTIWTDVNCSAGLSNEDMLKHGMAILALLMKLQQVRPVCVNVTCALPSRQTRIIAEISGQPLDLATAAFALCHAAFARHLMFGYATKRDGGFSDRIIFEEKEFRSYMHIPALDVAIPGACCGDTMIMDPVAWVNAKVAQYTGTSD